MASCPASFDSGRALCLQNGRHPSPCELAHSSLRMKWDLGIEFVFEIQRGEAVIRNQPSLSIMQAPPIESSKIPFSTPFTTSEKIRG